MFSEVILVRHAPHGDVGTILSGRSAARPLTAAGRDAARRLAATLAARPIARVHAGPLDRARQTADAIAEAAKVPVETVAALDEVDFGDWTGRPFADLDADPAWRHWNEARAIAAVPGGETMAAAQTRALSYVRRAAALPGITAMVSHCDIIRAVLAGILGLPLDYLLRFDVDPASFSRLACDGGELRVASINEQPR